MKLHSLCHLLLSGSWLWGTLCASTMVAGCADDLDVDRFALTSSGRLTVAGQPLHGASLDPGDYAVTLHPEVDLHGVRFRVDDEDGPFARPDRSGTVTATLTLPIGEVVVSAVQFLDGNAVGEARAAVRVGLPPEDINSGQLFVNGKPLDGVSLEPGDHIVTLQPDVDLHGVRFRVDETNGPFERPSADGTVTTTLSLASGHRTVAAHQYFNREEVAVAQAEVAVGTTPTADGGVDTPKEPPPPPAAPSKRLGLHVSAGELAIWRDRARNGPYRVPGDVIKNSPGDWKRIEELKDLFMKEPSRYAWQGPTHDYPNAIINHKTWPRDPTGMPGKFEQKGASEPIRDAAFYAMVLGAEQVENPRIGSGERDAILREVKTALLRIVRSKYNDYSNRKRYNPNNQGNSFHPLYQMARWMTINIFAYDYAQVANPRIWSNAEKKEFIQWLDDGEAWYSAKVDQRRNGMFNANGSPTDYADEPYKSVIWSGGPRAEKVHARMDNHVARISEIPTLTGLLANLEQERSGVSALGRSRIAEMLERGRQQARDYLVAELIPRAPGKGGGVATAGGNFYRWGDPPPINGWKYAMSHLGRNLLIADHLARAGDTSAYEYSTTMGTSVSAGRMPDDGLTNGGPKTFRGALRQLSRFVDESSKPVRYGCDGCSSEAYRIDSRDDIHNIYRANEWEVMHANVYFRDPYFKKIYMRALPGTPELPPRPKSGQGRIQCGVDGAYPGANFMFGQMEGKVWPYPN